LAPTTWRTGGPEIGPFEVAVGAVLVQHAAWRNAELALNALRDAGALAATISCALPIAELERLVRSSGTFRLKAARIHKLARWWELVYPEILSQPTGAVRAALLGVQGIGPQTADRILLYAFGRPAVVVDAYLRRVQGRTVEESYGALNAELARELPDQVPWLSRAHAAIVTHAQTHCRKIPNCDGHPIRLQFRRGQCRHGQGST